MRAKGESLPLRLSSAVFFFLLSPVGAARIHGIGKLLRGSLAFGGCARWAEWASRGVSAQLSPSTDTA